MRVRKFGSSLNGQISKSPNEPFDTLLVIPTDIKIIGMNHNLRYFFIQIPCTS